MNNKALIIFIIISLITVLSVVFISTKEAASKEITSLTITQFKERLEDEENILIDIRTSQELENTGIIS
jgi:predicted sulfurtransferase